jgi:MFS family permease
MTRDLLLVAASLFTWGLGEGIFFYFQPLYLEELGANPVQIGLILGAASLVLAISQIPAGIFGDRIGRRPFMYASWIIGTLATGLMASAHSLAWFVPGLLLYGLTGFVTPPMNSYATEARGKWSVARALTFISAAYNLGMVAGPFLGGRMAESFGIRIAYVIATGIFVVSTAIIFFISDQPVHPEAHSGEKFDMLRNPRFVQLLGVIFVVVFSTYLPQGLSSNFLQNQRGLSIATIGLLGSIGSLGNALMGFSLGMLHTRRGYILSQIAVLVFSLSLWLFTGLPWIMIGYFMLGGYKVCRSLSMALTRPIVPESRMGAAYGFVETVSSLAIFFAPTVAGLLYRANPVLMYPISAVLIVAALGVSIWYLRSYHLTHDEVMMTPERGVD